MSSVNQFYQLTMQLIQLLESYPGAREDKLPQVENLMEQREDLLKDIIPPFTGNEVYLGRKLIELNGQLIQLLQAEKSDIQKDIKELQFKKESNSKYVNAYQHFSTDGMFYDKRK